MSLTIRIYIEGDLQLKGAFARFFSNALSSCSPRRDVVVEVKPLGSRSDAVKRFNQMLEKQEKDVLCLLLVDSEGPLDEGLTVKDNLQRILRSGSKEGEPFSVSKLAREEHLYLMVQSMEAWFLADKEKLAQYFGQRLEPQLLPRGTNVEAIAAAADELKHATMGKGANKAYDKIKDAVDLLRMIRPEVVAHNAPQCHRLIDKLTQLLCA